MKPSVEKQAALKTKCNITNTTHNNITNF